VPRVPAPLRPPAVPRRPPVPYPDPVPRLRRVPAVRVLSGLTPPVQRTPRDTAVAKPGPSAPAAPTAPSTPQIQLIPASAEGALDAAEEAVDLLLDSGRVPGEVLVITTGEPHPWAAHELSFGEAAYWAQHDAGDDVFYADASALGRAASRPVVVVAVNGGPDATAATALPLALGRAGTLLIVCGDPQQINSVLGAGV
jgi:hypothetical protein